MVLGMRTIQVRSTQEMADALELVRKAKSRTARAVMTLSRLPTSPVIEQRSWELRVSHRELSQVEKVLERRESAPGAE